MICPDCGADLSEQTVVDDGILRCAACGRIIDTDPTGTKSYYHEDSTAKINERYHLTDKLGEGSFGLVYKAYDGELQRFVAIKQPKITRQFHFNRELFLREARAASRLNHPNIISVFDVVQTQDKTWIISEWIDGISLRDWLDSESPSLDKCCQIMIKLCDAVEHAHKAGVIHRDIKPANVVMDTDGAPHLLDFGLSQSRTLHLDSIGGEGQPIGTPAFMAPEQVRGEKKSIDRTTDVYALGVVLYQLLTKSLPFRGRSSELYQKILATQPPPPRSINPSIPVSLEAICLKAMQKESAQRYSTAQEFGNDLNRFLRGEIVKAYGKLDRRALSHLARRSFLSVAAVSFGAATLGTTWYIIKKNQELNPRRNVRIAVSPTNAKVTFEQMSRETGEVVPDSRVETTSDSPLKLPPGFYRVTVTSGQDYFFAYRTVPADGDQFIQSDSGIILQQARWEIKNGTIILPSIQVIPTASVSNKMSFHAGGILSPTAAIGAFARRTYEVSPFLMDQTEVSLADFKAVFPSFQGGQESLSGAIVGISFDHALAYAEAVGKQLPTAWQLLWAATNGQQTKYPWGDTVDTMNWPERYREGTFIDENRSAPPIRGLFSGPLEWADTPPPPLPGKFPHQEPLRLQNRAVFGGPLTFEREDIASTTLNPNLDPMQFGFKSNSDYHKRLGFRCVRLLTNS